MKTYVMTPEYFESLDDEAREDILTESGVFLADLEKNGLIFHLYQVDGFYVEFCYRISKSSTVTTCIFTDPKRLDPYLADMEIDVLVH